MISRDWQCGNRACRQIFHSFEKGNPDCPHCGCARVSWVPGGGHIGKIASGADATLRSLATDYGMANLNSPSHSRLNRAAARYDSPPVETSLGVKHFAPGFAANFSTRGATCSPSAVPVDLRGTQTVGRALSRSGTIPGPGANTEFAGRHIPVRSS